MTLAAESIGRALAGLGRIATRQSGPRTDSSREEILLMLRQAPEPLSVADISEQTDLHQNTIRTHLDLLRAAGLVDRVRDQSTGRGRPKWLYRAAESSDPYDVLARELSEALAEADGVDTAAEAAARWQAANRIEAANVTDPDEAVGVVAKALDRMGFDVVISPIGDAVYLRGCPYASMVGEYPIICDIHARAIEQVLAGTGQDVTLESMEVFARPGVCVAHLTRPEDGPARVITGQQSLRASRDKQRRPSPRPSGGKGKT